MSLDRREQLEKRRRLLKAAAGAPAMFTLLVGTPVAAATLTCAETSGEGPDPATLTPVDADGQPVDPTDPNAQVAYYVDDNGVEYYDIGEGQLVTGSCWASLGMGTTADLMGGVI